MHVPETWAKVDLATVPKEVRESITNDWISPELRNNPENVKRRIALYYANLAQMDENVGRILSALRELDLERDTIVLYTSDHGEMLGDHGLWLKMLFYEPAVKIPLLLRTRLNCRRQTVKDSGEFDEVVLASPEFLFHSLPLVHQTHFG